MESKARRIRYSRGFIPETVKEIRARLFTRSEENGDAAMEEAESDGTLWPELEGKEEGGDEKGDASEGEVEEQEVSVWKLEEVAAFTREREVACEEGSWSAKKRRDPGNGRSVVCHP
ncbi:hypothetical protein [Ktedonospora formicarum]|uniref:Uncharacterized protein n=1 Tax=Ktedonospora formicarum TaxID=2778364 RepID=A0A8J3I9Y7_9CHLR|nr:hypothetical protein [Ktedonospora formicarum]GHO48453.1 hypothetical protein KSX_66160 [Ktedonospora formicarum]